MPLIAPSCITAMRSLTPITSSMSLEIIRIGDAGVGERAHQLVDLALGADVDAARRLVEDHHLGLHRQPLGEHDLLLVAAGERADRASTPRRAECRVARAALGIRRVSRRADDHEAARRRLARSGSEMFSAIEKSSSRPGALAVLRHQVDAARRWRRAASAIDDRLAVEPDRAAERRSMPKTARASSVRPEPTSPARPRISPLRSVEADRLAGIGGGAHAVDLEQRSSPGGVAGGR